ncbi:MAG TPA: hypothetical protein VLE74_03525 [Candidatus Saccharimonadales bacterium]|nr:hypothetical protein [Candidatus Saccharimonadales bacterium]
MLKTKIRQYISWQRILAFVGLCFLVVASLYHPLHAQTISQGYGSDEQLQRGMIVRLKNGDATKIAAVSNNDAAYMYGVVISANDAPVTLSADNQKTFVATSGRYEVLVSNQNGAIRSGDFIAVSALAGIGMKAGETDTYVAGRALAGFDGNKDTTSTANISSGGSNRQVSLGRVAVEISIAKNPLLKTSNSNVPNFLQSAGESIAGKPVNAARIYVGLLLFVITTVLSSTLLYGGVRSAITAIGRNPLSRKSIVGGMVQVTVTGLIIFITGVFGVYLIIRL